MLFRSRQSNPKVVRVKTNPGKCRNRDFERLNPKRDRPLAKTVSDLARIAGKQNEWNREAHADNSLPTATERTAPDPVKHHECQYALEDIVIHGAKKLGRHQRHKTAFEQITFHSAYFASDVMRPQV